MRRDIFNHCIAQAQFDELFITHLGWNNPKGQTRFDITVDQCDYDMRQVADRNGFQVITCRVAQLPSSTACKKMDVKLRRQANDYICIFTQGDTLHHLWMAPVKKVEKREVVFIEYSSLENANFLYQKMDNLQFALDEETTIVDVREQVNETFIVNAEKVTKDFYRGFRQQHTQFARLITGIDNDHNRQWYTSVMLNRLMFCYFIQKKGFLNGNVNYLRDKLQWVKQEQGEDRFFQTFYRGFLLSLFHDGLNNPVSRQSDDFKRDYGRIPYLNGGMFDIHKLEKQFPDLDVKDEAFESLFAFFDTYHWHLDDRQTSTSGKDINPDVLGYIFEQYINDRAAMGAYYTKEDITEYIGRNTIVPFLMDELKSAYPSAFEPQGEVWQLVKESGDRYIFDAVCRGTELELPPHIAVGIDTTQPNLLERRSHWNERTPQQYALPTEIWRETIERRQRYEDIRGKIERGEVIDINDFITYNLDIRLMVQDLLERTQDHHIIMHFFHALQRVTILDPTCGSGAFLFAALNILEPFYETCIMRMQEFHEQNQCWFINELDEINGKYRSNIQYFIYKSIILRNLYGVDIMDEAVEIAKLRLFLKMVAVADVDRRAENMGLDPLPDVDFNIRCGNTLVGYATAREMEQGINFGDLFSAHEFRERVMEEMEKVARAYQRFKESQFTQVEDAATFKQSKADLRQRLQTLNMLLNRQMYKSITQRDVAEDDIFTNADYQAWLKSHKPFHWLAEFYDIIQGNGGFDVIIGNPPYVEYNKKVKGIAVSDIYRLHGYKTIDCGNLYAFCMERTYQIGKDRQGFIIPISFCTTPRMKTISGIYKNGSLWLSNYCVFPQTLFDGVHQRLSIALCSKEHDTIMTTRYYKWYADERKSLFQTLAYCSTIDGYLKLSMKIGNPIGLSVCNKYFSSCSEPAAFYRTSNSSYCLYYKNTGVNNWIVVSDFPPKCYINDIEQPSSREAHYYVKDENRYILIGSIANSSLFYFLYCSNTNCRDLNPSDIENIRIPKEESYASILYNAFIALSKNLNSNSYMQTRNQSQTGKVNIQSFRPRKSKPIIDEIDKLLAKHYSFTEEELDFIINYDIKYRMGDELNNE